MAAFIAQPDVAGVIVSGETKTSIRTAAGLQVDLRVVQLDAWGAALQYFTGSTAHNVAVRQIAVRNKLRLSEYGLFEAEQEGGEVGGSSSRAARRRSTPGWAWPGYRPRCARTTVRSRQQPGMRYRCSFGKMIFVGTCTRTPTSPTG